MMWGGAPPQPRRAVVSLTGLKNICIIGEIQLCRADSWYLHSALSKMMGQPCLVSEAADIWALKVEMPLSRPAIMEWPV